MRTVDTDGSPGWVYLMPLCADEPRRTPEGASIDKRDHAADPCGQIVEELTEDDLRAIAEDTKQPIERARDVMYPGLTRKLTTADGSAMTISYGTSADTGVEDETHTGRRSGSRRSARGRPMSSGSPTRPTCSSP